MKKVILITLLFLLTGCYDYVEINDLVIVTGMLIDYQKDEYVITTQVIENENKSEIKVFKTKGETIEECLSELSKLSNKDIFISHLKVLILTENTIKSNTQYYNYFLRDSKSKMNFYIYYVDDKYKDDILNIYKDNSGSALYLKNLMEFNNKIFSSSTPVSFLDLMYRKYEYGINEVYPNLIIKENNGEKVLYLQDIILFNDKEKIVLNDIEGIYYNMITNNIKRTTINIPCDNNEFTISINDSKTKNKWHKNIFYIDTSLTSTITSYSCNYDLDEPNTSDKLSKIVNEYIKDNMEKLISKSKKNKIDFLGIGNYIYKHDNKFFNFKKDNWNDKLQEINIHINIDTTINSIGEMRI